LIQWNNFNISFTWILNFFVVKEFFEGYNKPRIILELIAINENKICYEYFLNRVVYLKIIIWSLFFFVIKLINTWSFLIKGYTLCRIFYNILAAIDRDWNDHVISDSCSTMMAVSDQARRYSVVLIGIQFLAAFFLTIGAYVFHTMNNVDSEVSRELPLKMQVSSVVLESPLFECILALQIFYLLSLSSVVGMINALLVTLVSIICYKISLCDFKCKNTL